MRDSSFMKKKKEEKNERGEIHVVDLASLLGAYKPSFTDARQLLTSCRAALIREFTTRARIDSAR